jgi:hypothetical protein
MAFAQTQMWLCEFRVPADDYLFPHLLQHNGVNDEAAIRALLAARMSPDARIERLYRVRSPLDTQNRLAAMMEEAKGAHRALVGDELTLSKAEVDALGGPAVTAASGQITIPTAADVARAQDAASR